MSTTKENIAVYIEFFGAFREYGAGVELSLESGCRAEQVKLALESTIGSGAANLLAHSVLADEEQILGPDWQLDKTAYLAILPPVSGG
ncbi:hypothetical protein LRD18_01215 [Halorhodospira halochloris]|uniref:MoaD/ThiS family protein n=1 Tax=Halorhodospira halochloris TaxID=1052 RepID=UPI001EE9A275|nr:hypothetical protein [Halorhodospira halochloris]MCG5529492.1 hypothetical protein [Halorhodospira halochloris]